MVSDCVAWDRPVTEVVVHNLCALELIDSRFAPLIEAARSGMVACCGDRLQEIRLQGSIARGDARVGLADLDMLALLDASSLEGENHCLAELAETLGAGTELVSRFDLEAVDVRTLSPFRRFVLSSDSVCVYGADSLTVPAQPMERFTLAQLVTPDPATMLPDYLAWAEELAGANEAERRFASRIIGKDLLKVLRGMLLLRGAGYEVAIPRIGAQVSFFAPEATGIAGDLYALYCEPTTDVAAVRRAVTAAASFLEGCPEVAFLHSAGDVGPAVLEGPDT